MFTDPNIGLFEACAGGHKKLAESMIERGANNWNDGLFEACKFGHIELIELMIAYGANLEYGLFSACYSGHTEIIKLIISRKNQVSLHTFNMGMTGACQGGQKDIVEWMIQLGAYSLSAGLYSACLGGHKEIIELMIAMGATHWNWGLDGACSGGNKEIATLMIEKGAYDWNLGLSGACFGGQKEMAEWMIEKVREAGGTPDWNSALVSACAGGRREMVEFIIESSLKPSEKGAQAERVLEENRELDLNKGLGCAYYRHKDLIKLLISHGANQIDLENLTERDIEYFLLHNVSFNTKYEQLARRCVSRITFSLTNLLYPHLNNDLISIIFEHLW